MRCHLAIAYDRIKEDSENPTLQNIVSTLVNAEAKEMRPVLNTTIEFVLEVEKDEKELFWIIDEIGKRIKHCAYYKIYIVTFPKGEGKIYNVDISSKDDNRFIGKSFQEAKLHAEAAKISFRNEFN